jgi:Outer membrane protein beta-barrel domain
MLGLAVAARAQVAPASYGGNQTIAVGGMVSGFRLDYGKRNLGGAGVFVDGNFNDRWGLQGEANWLWVHQFADTHYSTYLAGPRLTFNPYGNLRPYIKGLAGGGLVNFPYSYAHGSYFVAAGGGGLDYHVAPRIRLRLVDFEYQYWPQFSFGAIKTYGVSVGVEYQIFGCSHCEPRRLGR